MMTRIYKTPVISAVCAMAITCLSGIATAQSTQAERESESRAAARARDTASSRDTASARDSKAEREASKHVNDAVAVVHRLEATPGMSNVLKQAKGVLIVPTYGRAALGVGGSGGAGVLLAKNEDGTWSDPAFYNIGGINVGAQIGAEGGPIAFVLNNDKAINSFMQKNNFSLTADAGLTIVNWSKMAQGEAGTGDILAWSGAKGLFGNVVSIGVNDVRFNQNETNAYYRQAMTAHDAISGKAQNPQADGLKQALAAAAMGSGSRSMGSGSSSSKSGRPADENNKSSAPGISK